MKERELFLESMSDVLVCWCVWVRVFHPLAARETLLRTKETEGDRLRGREMEREEEREKEREREREERWKREREKTEESEEKEGEDARWGKRERWESRVKRR